MKQRWNVWRILGAVIGIALLGFGLTNVPGAYRFHNRLTRAKNSNILEADVDFSRPGHFNVRAVESFHQAHKAVVFLRLPSNQVHGDEPSDIWAGLRVSLSVSNRGKPLPNWEHVMFDTETNYSRGDTNNGTLSLFTLPLVPYGVYETSFVVERGAQALKGLPQKLEGRYELCGLEDMMDIFGLGICGGSSLLGLIIVTVVWRRISRS